MAISDRGFASIGAERMRSIASQGGRASHERGVGHEWTPESARAAALRGSKSRRKRVVDSTIAMLQRLISRHGTFPTGVQLAQEGRFSRVTANLRLRYVEEAGYIVRDENGRRAALRVPAR
jgi:hypothetical protein